MTHSNRSILVFVTWACFTLIGYVLLQSIVDETLVGTDINLSNRGIDSPLKKLFGGHLGVFFRFEFLGAINFLALPFLFHHLIHWKKLEKWLQVSLLLYGLCLGLIVVKGYFNFRYMQTLLPITVAYVCFSTWQLSGKTEVKWIRPAAFTIIGVLVVFNFYNYMILPKLEALRERVESTNVHAEKKDEPIRDNITASSPTTLEQIGAFLDGSYVSHVPHKRLNKDVSLSEPSADIYGYVANVDFGTSNVLCNNLPGLYYYSDAKAMYYWCEDDHYYGANGIETVFLDRTIEETYEFIVQDLACAYVMTYKKYNMMSSDFEKFLSEYCVLQYEDTKGYQLYGINDTEATVK